MQSFYAKSEVRKLQYGALAVATVLILFGTYQKIFSLGAFAILCLLVFFSDEEFTIIVMVFTMPFAMIYKFGVNSLSFYTYQLMLYALKEFFVQRKLPGELLVFALVIFAQQFMLITLSMQRTLKLMSGLLFIFYSLEARDKYKGTTIYITFIMSIVVSALFAFMDSPVFRIGDYLREQTLGGGVVRFCGLNNDPNYYTINVIVSLCLLSILLTKKTLPVPLLIGAFVFMLFLAIYSYSKSSILMLAIPFACVVYSNIICKRRWLQITFVIAAVVFVMGVISGKITILDVILNRFSSTDGDLNKLTTGRLDLWEWYIEFYFTHPFTLLFGRGIGAEKVIYASVHNLYLQIPFYIGVAGEIWIFRIMAFFSRMRDVVVERNLMNYAPLVCLAIMYCFLGCFFDYQVPVQLLVAFLAINEPMGEPLNREVLA